MAIVDEDKYRNAILYFASHVRCVGRTKLWKLLYYLDFDHFEINSSSVTGEQYLKWANGPVPSHGIAILERMEFDGDVRITPVPTGLPNPLLKVEPLRTYDKSVFSPAEWESLQAVARKWKFHSAREMSNATHGESPWIQAEPNGALDYELAGQRGVDQADDDLEEGETEVIAMKLGTDFTLARNRSLAYAERIERLWDTDVSIRTQIEQGIQQVQAGQTVAVSIDSLLTLRRESSPS